MQEIERIKVYVSDLKPGMYVAELDRPWLGTPFLFQGFPITNDEQISQLQECCQHVFFDVTHDNWPLNIKRILQSNAYGIEVRSLVLEGATEEMPVTQ